MQAGLTPNALLLNPTLVTIANQQMRSNERRVFFSIKQKNPTSPIRWNLCNCHIVDRCDIVLEREIEVFAIQVNKLLRREVLDSRMYTIYKSRKRVRHNFWRPQALLQFSDHTS